MIPNDIIRHLAKTIPAVIVLFSAAVPPQGNSLLAGIQQALGYVRTEQAAIAGITVGSTEEQLFHALGKPTELKDLPSGRDSTKNVRLFRYPGVDVEVAGGKVSVVRCSAPRYATPDGVRVGDSLVRPIRLYGATKFDIAGDERVDWYGVMNTDAFLVFRFRGEAVSGIELCGLNRCERLRKPQPTSALYALDVLASRVSVGDFTGTVHELVEFIRWHHGTMISFVEAQDYPPIHVYLNNASVQELLASVVRLRPEYRYETILNRVVLYPIARMYQHVVTGIHVEGLLRGEAKDRYIKILRSRDPDFDDLGRMEGVIDGASDGPTPFIPETVSLTPRARVIEHFVQLLGDDYGQVLTITYSGVPGEPNSQVKYRNLIFEEVRMRR